MLVFGFAMFGASHWSAWVPLGVGAGVTSLVIGFTIVYGRLRRSRRRGASREEDLNWPDLLRLLEERNRDRAAAGLPPRQATDEEFVQLLARLPNPRSLERPEDREFLLLGDEERRAGGRRWGNPTEVQLRSALWFGPLHGVVVNRSTGGLGILADKEVPPGTTMKVRAVEAPPDVPVVLVEVRHCRKAGSGYLFGCRFGDDVPWNARVWFG